MGALMRSHDWTHSPLGYPANWPDALKMSVSICLNSRFPMVLWWGPDFIMLYNDAWRPVLGATKHPSGFGRPGVESWPEIWDIIGEQMRGVLEQGEATWSDNLLLVFDRYGYLEEAYFTYSYSPIKDVDGRIGGVFSAVSETTDRVLGERRLEILRELGERSSESRTVQDACSTVAEVLRGKPDVPFALLYLLDGSGRTANLVAAVGVDAERAQAPAEVDLDGEDPWCVARVVRSGEAIVLDDLASRFGPLPGGHWPEPTVSAMILPIAKAGQRAGTTGVLITGINPRRALDGRYRGFFGLVAGHMATAVANARAYEEERTRAEALAEIDRAKTAFFSNASHEFRTPLTLMISPLEDLLVRNATSSHVVADKHEVELIHRNSLRLLKLVNTLLDFSRIEAGRIQAVYEPVDLAVFTAELASTFRSAMDRAELRFIVDCPPLPEPLYVDHDMWEKIVLNLVSNAFKYTFEGEIAVVLRLAADGRTVELTVRDTGVGIPEHELPRLFERFHRIEGQRGRTQEGTGIGLALVQELVRLHGGSVQGQSVLGRGTSFTVSIPTGQSHLPPDRVGGTRTAPSTGVRAEAFAEEALRWLPGAESAHEVLVEKELIGTRSEPAPAAARSLVLLADDNADMRDYVGRLLNARYDVTLVTDGGAALNAARQQRPDLILSDVMMPGLDGFGLLRALRADPDLRDIPVVLLSARAGEEAKVEGLEAGADDYLIKPFSARELLARVATNLETARIRREAAEELRRLNETLEERIAAEIKRLDQSEHHFRLLVEGVSDYAIYMLDINGLVTDWNTGAERIKGYTATEITGQHFSKFYTEKDRLDGVPDRALKAATRSGKYETEGWRVRKSGDTFWAGVVIEAIRDETGQLVGFAKITRDLTEKRAVEEQLRQAQKMEAIGQLTGGVAHDFNNLLQVVLGNIDALRRRGTKDIPKGDDGFRRLIDGAARGAERAATLTQQLLAFSRRQPLAPKTIDLNKLVTGMSDMLHRTLGETTKIETVLAGGMWRVAADPNQLESALLNLAVNARDAMPEGGKLTIETANAHLDEPYSDAHEEVPAGQYALIAVTDSGTGMSKEVVAKAFEPFFTTKEFGRGTGLGLSQVYGFVKQSGGHVKIYSEAGAGTTVKLYLPRLVTAAPEPETSFEIQRVPSGTKDEMILVVEDDEDVRANSTDMLHELGYGVLEAPDGRTALRVLEAAPGIRLLFTDVGLPGGLNGRQLADEARRRFPALKVLFTTGYARNAIVHNGTLDAGVELIVKPFSYVALATKVRQMLDRSGGR